MDKQEKKSIPVLEGLFTWPSEDPHLIGTKCNSCGAYFFPKKSTCNNPDCVEKKVEDVLLSTEGKLWNYTIQTAPPPLFDTEQKPPFIYGIVELSEGIRVIGLVTRCEPEKIRIGMDMKLIVEALYHNKEGQEVVDWKFMPLDKKS